MFVLLSRNGYSDNNTVGLIRDYLELSVELSQDTVCLDSELTLTAVFKNKTDSCVTFYPVACLSVVTTYVER